MQLTLVPEDLLIKLKPLGQFQVAVPLEYENELADAPVFEIPLQLMDVIHA